MITIASILDSAQPTTKIIFHLGIIGNFSLSDMLQIYELRERINNNSEFNFYDASEYVNELLKTKQNGMPGSLIRLTYSKFISKDVDHILSFDAGDVLVLRDLTEYYNLNMDDNHYLGVRQNKPSYEKYINIGSMLINLTKLRDDNMYNVFVNKIIDMDQKRTIDELLINRVCKVGFVEMKYGAIPPFESDDSSDKYKITVHAEHILVDENTNKQYPYTASDTKDWIIKTYNYAVIHSWNAKWKNGKGMSIHRRLAQYYIKLAGIWDIVCNDKSIYKYCNK